MDVCVPYVCLLPILHRRLSQISWNRSSRMLWAAMGVLGMKPGSFGLSNQCLYSLRHFSTLSPNFLLCYCKSSVGIQPRSQATVPNCFFAHLELQSALTLSSLKVVAIDPLMAPDLATLPLSPAAAQQLPQQHLLSHCWRRLMISSQNMVTWSVLRWQDFFSNIKMGKILWFALSKRCKGFGER